MCLAYRTMFSVPVGSRQQSWAFMGACSSVSDKRTRFSFFTVYESSAGWEQTSCQPYTLSGHPVKGDLGYTGGSKEATCSGWAAGTGVPTPYVKFQLPLEQTDNPFSKCSSFHLGISVTHAVVILHRIYHPLHRGPHGLLNVAHHHFVKYHYHLSHTWKNTGLHLELRLKASPRLSGWRRHYHVFTEARKGTWLDPLQRRPCSLMTRVSCPSTPPENGHNLVHFPPHVTLQANIESWLCNSLADCSVQSAGYRSPTDCDTYSPIGAPWGSNHVSSGCRKRGPLLPYDNRQVHGKVRTIWTNLRLCADNVSLAGDF